MLVIALCAIVAAAGVAIIARLRPAGPEPPTELPWYLITALGAGLAAGVIAAGAAGRLIMRLLALTSPDARGSITEAEEVVGEITFGGTLGFVVFAGLGAGLVAAVLYALLRPILPARHAGGVALGALLLVLVGTRIEPLRADNFDFNIVGPAWLAVLSFTVLALFQGMVTVALAERMAEPPKLHGRPRIAAQVVLAVVVLAALPGFAGALSDILD